MDKEESNLIGWQHTLLTSTPNHIYFLLVHVNKCAICKIGLTVNWHAAMQSLAFFHEMNMERLVEIDASCILTQLYTSAQLKY